jgi:hypothetical protein
MYLSIYSFLILQLRSNAIPLATEWLLNNPQEDFTEEMTANPTTEEPTEDVSCNTFFTE